MCTCGVMKASCQERTLRGATVAMAGKLTMVLWAVFHGKTGSCVGRCDVPLAPEGNPYSKTTASGDAYVRMAVVKAVPLAPADHVSFVPVKLPTSSVPCTGAER